MTGNETYEEKLKKADSLARDVLKLSRNTLLVNLRFLDMALSRFEPESADIPLATDGKKLWYHPAHVLRCYTQAKERPTRDYLHMVMHCVYRHMFIHSLVDRERWGLACDIAVENAINELALPSCECERAFQQEKHIESLKGKVKTLTAEKLYRYFLDSLSDAKVAELRKAFAADDHTPWFEKGESGGDGGGAGDGSGEGKGEGSASAAAVPSDGVAEGSEEDWKKISERMQQDLETFSKLKGDAAGGMMQNLREVNREKYDYASFLRKFAVLGEVMKINDDEFDYVFYTYGLQLYKNMPLIEPLEYKDVKRIREFVIAIDTSGSVAGEIVQKFVQKTYNILKSTESFFSKINLHIIQCDAEIQEDVKITSQQEFDAYLKNMTIKGLGGTDFRPVFTYVDKLIDAGEFSNLKGLIYFTDGFGDFPEHKPPYQTAFVYLSDDVINPEVPPWAIKLVLQSEEI